ncbi:MAG: hypothetical protein V3U53_09340 [bacterium]
MPYTGQPKLLISEPDFELLRFDLEQGLAYVLLGDVDSGGAGRVLEAFQSESGEGGKVEFLMEDAELIDGISVTRMVEAVRCLLRNFDQVRLIYSPQMLAHSIYKVGMLKGGAGLELVDPREEEGGAN